MGREGPRQHPGGAPVTFAEIHTTHNPNAFFAVSLVALIANVALAAYQLRRIRARRLNPLTDELYNDAKSYREVVEENRRSAANRA